MPRKKKTKAEESGEVQELLVPEEKSAKSEKSGEETSVSPKANEKKEIKVKKKYKKGGLRGHRRARIRFSLNDEN